MKKMTVNIHAEPRDKDFLQAILTLAGSALSHDWDVVNDDASDVVLVSFNSESEANGWNSKALARERLIAYADEKLNLEARWRIRRRPESPPRLSELVQVFNDVAHQVNASDTVDTQPEAGAVQAIFQPERYLAGIVQRVNKSNEPAICSADGFPPVFLFPKEHSAYTKADAKTLSAFCRLEKENIEVTHLSEFELRTEIAALGFKKSRMLSELLWFSVLAGSGGRLLSGHSMDEPVYLREWPGYVRLPYYGLYQEVATRMAGGSATLGEIAKACEAPVQIVVDFHNACETFGLVARGEEAKRLAAEKNQAQEELREFLRKQDAAGHAKLLIAGSIGAGKTTAITTLSETPPILTETSPTDAVAAIKPTTTVAMEYGELLLEQGRKFQLYGTPGQRRFDFMGSILCRNAWGLLILIDNTLDDPLGEVDYYLSFYAEHLHCLKIAIGISHYESTQPTSPEDYRRHLKSRDFEIPVLIIDTRCIHSLSASIAVMAKGKYSS